LQLNIFSFDILYTLMSKTACGSPVDIGIVMPNLSIERTAAGKSVAAVHVKR
jgi:hypothetical protein